MEGTDGITIPPTVLTPLRVSSAPYTVGAAVPRQLILVAAGLTPQELDNQPVIRVGEAISSYFNTTPDSYYIKVELRDQNQNVIGNSTKPDKLIT